MTTLIRTPRPYPTESLCGYVLRLSEANGYPTPSNMMVPCRAGGPKGIWIYPVLEKLAEVTGAPIQDFEKIRNRDAKTQGLMVLGRSFGTQWGSNYLRLRTPAFCPQCVVEMGFIDAVWDINLMSACPIHKCACVESCRDCGAQLTHQRPGLLTCVCGADLSAAPPLPASQDILELSAVLMAKAHGKSIFGLSNQSGLPFGYLESMSLLGFYEMLDNLGRHALGMRKGIASVPPIVIASKVAGVLARWPTGYHNFLRQIDESGEPSVVDTTRLKGRYSKYLSSMFTRGQHSGEYGFLREEFVRFGNEVLDNCAVPQDMADSASIERRWVSKAELCTLLGITAPTLPRLLKNFPIPTKAVRTEKTVRHLFDVSHLDKSYLTAPQLLSLQEAATLSGIPRELLVHFKKCGLLEVANPAMRGKSSYSKRDIERFVSKLIERADPMPAGIQATGELISFSAVLSTMKFGGVPLKTNFVEQYLRGDIDAVGRTNATTTGIFFRKDDVRCISRQSRHMRSDALLSYADVDYLLGSASGCAHGLCKLGYLQLLDECKPTHLDGAKRHGKIKVQSVESFGSQWIAALELAKALETTAVRIQRVAQKAKILMLHVRRRSGAKSYISSFVTKVEAARIKALIQADFAKYGVGTDAHQFSRSKIRTQKRPAGSRQARDLQHPQCFS